jgi:tetratricopeptide (TPR) repeat protein
VLADKILIAQVQHPQRIATLQKDADFKRLMTLLAGYPLAMEVVLANLATQSPQDILAALHAADVDLNVGGNDKTNNILKCVEYSHSNLSPQAQKLLVCLAPFNSFFVRDLMPQYAEKLQQHEPFAKTTTSPNSMPPFKKPSTGVCCLPTNPAFLGFLTIQPIFPYFLRTKLNTLDAPTRDALYDGFKAHYQALAGSYQQLMDSKDPNQRQLGLLFCRLEYENLYAALKICLEKYESPSIVNCLATYFEVTSDYSSELSLYNIVCNALREYPSESKTGEIEEETVRAFGQRANLYQRTQQYQQARDSYYQVLQLLDEVEGIVDRQKQSITASPTTSWASWRKNCGSMSRRERTISRPSISKSNSTTATAKPAPTTSWAMWRKHLREYEQARAHYQQALDIKIEFNDRYSQARHLPPVGQGGASSAGV